MNLLPKQNARSQNAFTLVEMSMAISIGLLVAIAAFAAVDAASKSIAASKRHSLEDDMIASTIRWIRNEKVSTLNSTFSGPTLIYHSGLLQVGTDWPAHWPILTVNRGNVTSGSSRSTYMYTFAISDNGGPMRYQLTMPITSLQ